MGHSRDWRRGHKLPPARRGRLSPARWVATCLSAQPGGVQSTSHVPEACRPSLLTVRGAPPGPPATCSSAPARLTARLCTCRPGRAVHPVPIDLSGEPRRPQRAGSASHARHCVSSAWRPPLPLPDRRGRETGHHSAHLPPTPLRYATEIAAAIGSVWGYRY